MTTDPSTNEQKLAIEIGNLYVELYHRLKIEEEQLKRKVNSLEKIAYEAEITKVEQMAAEHVEKQAEHAKRLAELNKKAQDMKEYLKRKFANSP